MKKHWTAGYADELTKMTQDEWEADVAQFCEHLVHWETGKPLTIAGMSKSMRDRGRVIKAEAIRRAHLGAIPAQFVGDIPDEPTRPAKPNVKPSYNAFLELHIENLPHLINKAGVKLTDEQLLQLKDIIDADYAKYPRTPLRNRIVSLAIHNSDKTLFIKDGRPLMQCRRTTQGNDGQFTLQVTGYNS